MSENVLSESDSTALLSGGWTKQMRNALLSFRTQNYQVVID
jgi:hypothetical protein